MKVFISWSGEFSRKVAERLSVWIQIIIQTVDVFYSPEDIEKGENWGNRLSNELEESNFGVICLTPENATAPWIHFEAGALSKATDSRVSAIMLGITPSDIKGPLARLQNTACNREDFFRLFQSINNSSDSPLKPEILRNAFDNSCERLMSDIDAIIKDYTSRAPVPEEDDATDERNSDREAIQEILRIVRNLDNSRKPLNSKSTSSNSLPRNDLNDERHFHLTGLEDDVQRAVSVINKYGKITSFIAHTGNGIYRFSACIPTEQLQSLKKELLEFVPEVHMEIR